MAPTMAAASSSSERQGRNATFRPLNAFMAFRSFYSKMLPHRPQKDRSGVLTALWSDDPYKNKWTMVAKVFFYLRAELGKDAVSLPSFLEHACSVLGIPPLDAYLQQRGFALLETKSGHLTLMRPPRTSPLSPASTPPSDDGIDQYQTQAEATAPSSSVFQEFKEKNMRTLAAVKSSLLSEDTLTHYGATEPVKLIVDEDAAAGLFAEHQLLQAVFDRGLDADLSRLSNNGNSDERKKWLVQKLYSMSYEMLIGGEFPVILSTNGFSRTIKHNPKSAAAQLFSNSRDLEFNVFVVNKYDRVRNHVLHQVKPGCANTEIVLPISGRQKTAAQTAAGLFRSDISKKSRKKASTPLTANATPTYTQNMAYQSGTHTGRFHIFSSQPSQLRNSIISSHELHDNSPVDLSGAPTLDKNSPSLGSNIEVNHMEFETEREISHPAASNHGQHNGTGRDSEGTNGSILSSTSRRAGQNYSSNGETVVNLEYSEVVNSRNANKVDDGREWLDHELERIHDIGPSHGSGNGNGNSGITGGHLSGGGHILTVSSNAPHDLYAIHSTDSNHIALLNNVLSTHLNTMGGDNEAANYMDRVAYLSASTVTSSAAASSTAAAAAVSSSSRHGPSRRLGKRSRDSSDMDGDTLTGDGSPPPTQGGGRPSKSKSKSKAKAKGKAKETSNDVDAGSPAKKVCSGHQDNQNDDEDLRFVNGCNRYSKNMKTPEPFPHDRPPVSFEDDYRVNLAISMQGATGEEDMPPITQAEQSSAVPLHQVPSTPPMRPLPAIPTAAPTTQTMPTAPSEPVMQPFGTTQPPMLHPDQTQQQHIRSYQSMQNMHTMRALQDMQTMGAMHGMQAMHPIPPQGLPTPTYDNNSAYMGYTFVPPQTSQHHGHQQHSFCGHGGLQSPDDEFIAIDNCLDMSTAPGIPMDFTDPDEIQRIMGFCENLGGSTHAVFDSMDDFQWI